MVLYRRHSIDAESFTPAMVGLSGWGLILLIAVGGYYTLGYIVLNAIKTPLAPGGKSPQRWKQQEKQGSGAIP